jgi:hypothetical protein
MCNGLLRDKREAKERQYSTAMVNEDFMKRRRENL